jgi:hypothetical protein
MSQLNHGNNEQLNQGKGQERRYYGDEIADHRLNNAPKDRPNSLDVEIYHVMTSGQRPERQQNRLSKSLKRIFFWPEHNRLCSPQFTSLKLSLKISGTTSLATPPAIPQIEQKQTV